MKFTIEQATAFATEGLEMLSMNDLLIDTASKARTVAVWLMLLGLTGGGESAPVRVAVGEVLNDAELFPALNMPAAEFVEWVRVQDWSGFLQYEATGSDAWAFTVLLNARAACVDLGLLARQRSIGI